MATFPALCKAKQGCGRIALENPWRNDGLAPLTFRAPAKEALYAVLQWVAETTAFYNRWGDASWGGAS